MLEKKSDHLNEEAQQFLRDARAARIQNSIDTRNTAETEGKNSTPQDTNTETKKDREEKSSH